MVAADRASLQRSRECEDLTRLRTSHDEVADEHESIHFAEADVREEVFQLSDTSVHVSDDDGSTHVPVQVYPNA